MKLYIAGTEIYISFAMLPVLAYQILSGETKMMSCAVSALILHECAHWIASRNLGYMVSRLSLYPFGAVMHLSSLCADIKHEWIAAAAGPVASFVIASAARMISAFFGNSGEWINLFHQTNLVIAVMNLLPAYPLDGGRIAKQILMHVCSENHTNRCLFVFSVVTALGCVGFGICLLYKGIPAWTLLALGPFLFCAAIRECGVLKRGTVQSVLTRDATIREGRAQKAQIIAIHTEATIGEAISSTSHVHYTIFYVTDGRRCFTFDENALLDAASEFGYSVRLKDAFDQQKNLCYNLKLKTGKQIGDKN